MEDLIWPVLVLFVLVAVLMAIGPSRHHDDAGHEH